MAAQQLSDQGRIGRLGTIYGRIEEARKQGDSHAAAEMSELLASLGDFGEI